MPRRESHAYGRFAKYYDFIYEDIVDYEGDVRFLEAVFRRWMRREPRTVLDLGSGTGNHAIPMARHGHDVTGLDLSSAQLAVARAKGRDAGVRIRFVRGDMRTFDLGQTFDAAVCMFGAFGYMLAPKEILGSLRCVRRHLRVDGLFIFEFWQSSGAKRAREDWFHKVTSEFELVRLSRSRHDPRNRLLRIEFRFFVFHRKRVLDRFDEVHRIRTHTQAGMRALLRRGGFETLAVYAATPQRKTFAPPRDDTFRIMVVARPLHVTTAR